MESKTYITMQALVLASVSIIYKLFVSLSAMKIIPCVLLLLIAPFLYGQQGSTFQKGGVQLRVALSLVPVQRQEAQVKFSYIDGNPTSGYALDTITADYALDQRYYGRAIAIGIGYLWNANFRTALTMRPHLNSFVSNKAKNGKVYGIQFDFEADYFIHLSKALSIALGTTASRIFGGYGITSNGAKNKGYLVVNGNELYDEDIGFHIIDNTWAIAPRIGLNYQVTDKISLFSSSGFQTTFGRSSKLNFAGLQKDGTVKWNSKSFDDPDVQLMIDQVNILTANIDRLPFKFSGVFFDLGTTIKLNK